MPWEKPTSASLSSPRPRRVSSWSRKAGQLLVQEGVEDRGREAHAAQDGRLVPVLEAEPLPPVGRHVAGKGRVRRDEGGARQPPRQDRRQRDEVVAVGAQAVQQDDQAIRLTGRRPVARPVEIEQSGHAFVFPMPRIPFRPYTGEPMTGRAFLLPQAPGADIRPLGFPRFAAGARSRLPACR